MKHQILVRGLGAALLAAVATINPANAVFVRTAPPPPPPNASVAMYRAPHHGKVWTAGYYRWRSGQYYWVPGRWMVPPRPGAVWVPARWRYGHGGYTFVAGRWR